MISKYLKTTHLVRGQIFSLTRAPTLSSLISVLMRTGREVFQGWMRGNLSFSWFVWLLTLREPDRVSLLGPAVQPVILEPAAVSPGSLLDMHLLRSHYSLLNPYPHFSKISVIHEQFECTVGAQ